MKATSLSHGRGLPLLRVRVGTRMCVLGAPLLSLVWLTRLSRSVCGDMHGAGGGGTGATGEGWRGRGELLGNFALATLYPWGCVAPAPSS